MKILDLVAKDVYVTFEMSRKQITHVLKVLELAMPIKYDSESDPEAKEACEYFENVFVPALDSIEAEISRREDNGA
jgi:hypothetical protein